MYMYASIAMAHLTQPTVLGRQGGCTSFSLLVDVPHKLRTACEWRTMASYIVDVTAANGNSVVVTLAYIFFAFY
jgi:hypothetical protein